MRCCEPKSTLRFCAMGIKTRKKKKKTLTCATCDENIFSSIKTLYFTLGRYRTAVCCVRIEIIVDWGCDRCDYFIFTANYHFHRVFHAFGHFQIFLIPPLHNVQFDCHFAIDCCVHSFRSRQCLSVSALSLALKYCLQFALGDINVYDEKWCAGAAWNQQKKKNWEYFAILIMWIRFARKKCENM